MDQRPLGRTGSSISAIGLGTVTFGREIEEEASWPILDYAIEKGITFLDTAEAYGGGNSKVGRIASYGIDDQREVTQEMHSSEKILGRWMKARGCRSEITLCTKVNSGSDAENIPKALAASLERLQTDSTDVYKLHSPDLNIPIEETLAALNEEVLAGRIGVIGCSNFSGAQLREALEVSRSRGYARFEITQPPYNLAQKEVEKDLFPLCREEEIAMTPYSPLGAGFLAGKYSSADAELPEGSRFHIVPDHGDIYFKDENFRMLERLRQKADEMGLPMVRLAMAFVMSSPDVTCTLVGARKFDHIDNALAACEMELDPELRAEMAAWTQ